MRRSLLPATAGLCIVTALALVGTVLVLRPPAPPQEGAPAPQESGTSAPVYAFYEAANDVIATGVAAAIEAAVAPDFVERSDPDGADADRDGLVRRLVAIHDANPALRLIPEAVAADGDIVIAQVRVEGIAQPTFAGLRLADAWTAWGPVDVFRVAHGLIVERRGPPPDPILPPSLRVPLEVSAPMSRTLSIARLTLAPGASVATPDRGGTRLVIGEIGTFVVEPIAARPGIVSAPSAELTTGGHLVLAAGNGVAVANSGPTPAALLDVALVATAWGAAAVAGSSAEEGVAVELLSDDLLITVPAPTVTLSVGRMTLDPGRSLAWSAAPGPVLLHVEAGDLDLTATAPLPWVRAVASEPSGAGVEAALNAGGGALLEAGTAAEVRATHGAATVMVVSLVPANDCVTGDCPMQDSSGLPVVRPVVIPPKSGSRRHRFP